MTNESPEAPPPIPLGPLDPEPFYVGANFGGSTINDSGFIPPDTDGAVGPNHFMELINGRYRVYTKSAVRTVVAGADTSLNTFWGTRNGITNPAISSTFDPRVIYDRTSGRWFATSLDNARTANSNYLVGVSSGANPTNPAGTWTGFSIDADANNANWADYPMMGVTKNWVTIGVNYFTIAGSYVNSPLMAIPKSSLLAGNINNLTHSLAPGSTGSSPHGVTEYEGTTDNSYFLSAFNLPAGVVRLSRYSLGTVANPTLTVLNQLTVPARTAPPNAPASGSTTDINTGDSRFSGNPVLVNGKLWAVNTFSNAGVANLAWYRINPATNVVEATGVIPVTAGLHVYFGSIAVNPQGDIVVGFSGSNASQFVGTYATTGNFDGVNVTWAAAEIQTRAGSASYTRNDTSGRNRWGDYSSTNIDPADPGSFWTIQEFAASPANTWSTQISEIIPSRATEIRWQTAANGNFSDSLQWFGGIVPGSGSHVIVSRWTPTAFTVTLPAGDTANDRLSIRQTGLSSGTTPTVMTFSIPSGATWTLSNTGTTTPSLAVSEFQGTSSVVFQGGGTLATQHTIIAGDAVGTGALRFTGAGTTWTNAGNVNLGGTSTAAGGIGTLSVDAGAVATVAGLLQIRRDNGATPVLTVAGSSTLTVGQLGHTGGTVPVINLTNANSSLVVNGNGAATSSFGGIITGAGTVTKLGTATVTLTGANTYSGGSNFSAGIVSVGNPSGSGTGSGNVVIGAGGRLQGVGIIVHGILNNVTVGAGASIKGGDSPGTLTIGDAGNKGTLNINDSADIIVDLRTTGPAFASAVGSATGVSGTGGADNSRIAVTGPLSAINFTTWTGKLVIGSAPGQASAALFDPASSQTYSFLVASANTVNGFTNLDLATSPGRFDLVNFTNANTLMNGGTVGFILSGGNLYLEITPVPEPASLLLIGGTAAGVYLRRRRRTCITSSSALPF